MDPRTGKLHETANPEYARRRGLVEVNEKEAKALRMMNRHQRRAWAAQKRRGGKP